MWARPPFKTHRNFGSKHKGGTMRPLTLFLLLLLINAPSCNKDKQASQAPGAPGMEQDNKEPKGPKATGTHAVTLTWVQSTMPPGAPGPLTGNRVFRQDGPSCGSASVALATLTPTTTYTDNNLPPNTQYSYNVTGVCQLCNSNGWVQESAPSNCATITTPSDSTPPPTGGPNPPTGLTITQVQ